jgi:hypothetical protein
MSAQTLQLRAEATAAKGGRPRAEREPGTAEKLCTWFEITGRSRTSVTKASKQLPSTLVGIAPTLKTLKNWMKQGVPRSAIGNLAKLLDVPPACLHGSESLENFRNYIRGQIPNLSTLLPARRATSDAKMVESLAVIIEFNENAKRALQIILGASKPLTVDQIADSINISVIQLREILLELMVNDVVGIAHDLDSAVHKPARIKLTDRATMNRILIETITCAAR